MTSADWCQLYLLQLEYEPGLMAIAAAFLEELATVAILRKNLRNEPIRQALQDMAVKAPVLIKGKVTSIKERPRIVLDLP
jgi:hypothetical protein